MSEGKETEKEKARGPRRARRGPLSREGKVRARELRSVASSGFEGPLLATTRRSQAGCAARNSVQRRRRKRNEGRKIGSRIRNQHCLYHHYPLAASPLHLYLHLHHHHPHHHHYQFIILTSSSHHLHIHHHIHHLHYHHYHHPLHYQHII